MTPFAEVLLEFRRRKDEFFASGRGPVRGAALEEFAGLSYYPPVEGLVFELPLTRSGSEAVMLDTSTGEARQMADYGTVTVPFTGGSETLTLYAQPGENAPSSLFLPFRDAGSGSESYGAGRYLDVPLTRLDGGESVRLDFNLAYHPYCAYGEGWTCPLPPAHNWLKVAVRAGERLG
ncbi:DUF1684 domain-containing protein [Deinococcus sp.]|uniref:DUF1684 domain-containing protein n=1 Tax=Deinococcus sp. TaxID=47478 RepID=UPI003CC6CD61